MDKVIFSSYNPYLCICLVRDEEDERNSIFVTFGADSTYAPKDEAELQLLRAYAKRTESSYLIAEGADPVELRRKYEELEEKRIQEAEARHNARLEAEKDRKEKYDFYSLLRMSDKAYR